MSSSKKIFVFDTSTFLDNSKSLFDFGTSDIVIPLKVLEEIDNHKKRQDSVGANARDIIRTLDSLREKGSLAKGVRIQKGLGIVRVIPYDKKFDYLLGTLDSSIPDNEIIGTAAMVKEQNPDNTVILVTRDINLRVKCDSLNIECQDYKKDKIVKTSSEIYTGFETFVVSDELVAESYKKDVEIPEELSKTLFPNQFVRLVSELDEKRSSVLIWNSKLNKLKTLDEYHGGVSKIKPRNKEQQAAFNILLDENIDFVTMTGTSGCGKSLLSLAAALELLEKSGSKYQKIIVSRPVVPMGKDIGFLPGPQPLDAKILTPSGWTTMGEVKPGDRVISRDGKSTGVLSIHPQGEKEIYRITFSDGSSTKCCEDHLWYTSNEREREKHTGSVKSLKEIISTLKVRKGVKRNHSIPMVEPVEFDEQSVEIDPYLLGILLGDGSLSIKTHVSFTTADPFIAEEAGKNIPENLSIKNKTGTITYAITRKEVNSKNTNGLITSLKKLNLMGKKSYEKFVPKEYLFNSKDIRLAVLQGLMDSDGTVGKGGTTISFSSTSQQLAKDVQFLVQSFGGKATIQNKQTYFTYKGIKKAGLPSFVVQVSVRPEIQTFLLPRKLEIVVPRTKYVPARYIESVELVGKFEAQCILVENPEHLYVTDDFIVTHNTMEEKMSPWLGPIYDNLECILNTKDPVKKGKSKTLDYYFDTGIIEIEALTFIRGRSIPNAIVIIDEAQQLSGHEMKTILTRAGEGSKLIVSGDPQQIDNPFVDETSNGLTYAIEKMKHLEYTAHISLRKGERSRLATSAADLL